MNTTQIDGKRYLADESGNAVFFPEYPVMTKEELAERRKVVMDAIAAEARKMLGNCDRATAAVDCVGRKYKYIKK